MTSHQQKQLMEKNMKQNLTIGIAIIAIILSLISIFSGPKTGNTAIGKITQFETIKAKNIVLNETPDGNLVLITSNSIVFYNSKGKRRMDISLTDDVPEISIYGKEGEIIKQIK